MSPYRISSALLPPAARVRDVVLTVAAWLLFLYLLADLGRMAVYWLRVAIGAPSPNPAWSPGEMWRQAVPFLRITALFVIWLFAFAALRWHALRRRSATRPPPIALDPSELQVGVELVDGAADILRGAKISVVTPRSTRDGAVVYGASDGSIDA